MGDETSAVDLFGQMSLFNGLDTDQLAQIAEHTPTLVLSRNEIVYEQGSESDTFYIILSGHVQLIRAFHQAERSLGVLEDSDYFGQEALEPAQLRQTSAKAATDIVVLVFAADYIKELIERYPVLKKRFKIITDSFRFFLQLDFPWLGPRESIYYIGRRHIAYLIPRLILPGLMILLLLPLWISLYVSLHMLIFFYLILATALIGAAWVTWVAFDWSNDYSIITNRRVLFQEKIILIYDSRQEVPLDAVLADDVTTSQIGRWFDFGDLIIRTYTGAITLPGISMPSEVKVLLDNRRQRANIRAQRNKRQTIRSTIRQHLGIDEEMPTESSSEEAIKPTIHTGTLPNALSNLFMLRTEVNGVITYRTHWFILLSKVALPSLLLFLTLTLLIARLVNAVTFLSIPSTVLLCLLLFLIFGLWELYQYVDWSNDRYIITDRELIDVYKRPLGVEQKRTAPLENILSIDYERPNLIHLILNFGTVYIRIGEASLTFNNVFNPADVQREIFERFLSKKLQKQQQSDADDQRRLAEWLEIYHQEVTGPVAGEENPDDEEEENE
ncbi:protein containg cyclic nucleotide-binding domain [Longilinea arvoryzae]|uniref:Protein containg cyclic nucleotide-binding domain n=1 Tax=Longilinea arvoryzae TaxID=360412 RepID=A0A0S7BNE6_9CHLR|nr:cyclic nucleotide-binding domain-containing protein [Longilinea arvoryzae]GAP15365.1 protein containg cyclic nucleotide-binding domain [Longilinea arvoryzae]